MIRVFLINLDSRRDRYLFVKKQLDEIGLPFARISAADGHNLTAEEQFFFNRQRFLIENKRNAAPGEIGCAVSHRAVWKKMLDEKLEFALIIEDDVTLSHEIIDFLKLKSNYSSFDFLNLSSAAPYHPKVSDLNELIRDDVTVRPGFWKADEKQWKKIEWRNRWRIFKLHKTHSRNTIICECDPAPALGSGYIVSRNGAKHLFKASCKMYYPIDLTWRHAGGFLRQGFASPPLIEQTLGDSDIEGRKNGGQLKTSHRIMRFFCKSRRLRRRLDVFIMYGWKKIE